MPKQNQQLIAFIQDCSRINPHRDNIQCCVDGIVLQSRPPIDSLKDFVHMLYGSTNHDRKNSLTSDSAAMVLYLSFFVSGCSALIYQVCWQRALYGVLGIDIDSVTIIVSVFMLGIGIGGMLGGWLADHYPKRRIAIYVLAELAIAVYGASTLWSLPWLDTSLSGQAWNSAPVRAIASFIFLIVPTTLMGMTLPVLTVLLNEKRKNIGVSVGTLYFVNTMGAAVGAGLVPITLLPLFNLSQVIWISVVGNLVVGLLAATIAIHASRCEATQP